MKIYTATIKEKRRLTKHGSCKETCHLVLDLGSTLPNFKVGDSLGIYPQNDPFFVQEVLHTLHATGNEQILDPRSQTPLSLKEFLTCKANLSRLPSAPTLQEFCNLCRPLLPRFYSIASSPLVYKQEIHLTVALFTFSVEGTLRHGVASYFLCSLAEPHKTPIPCYIQPQARFTLPSSDTTPIILIGAGTGIAPYRAFLQERLATNAPGKNWLFFGECSKATDYLYETEIESWHAQQHLRLNLAFSRDQSEKIYVQHRMLEESRDLWHWLEDGAYIYVCGDARHMAKDVDKTLHVIAQKEGGLNEDAAKNYIKQLRKAHRYLLDVY